MRVPQDQHWNHQDHKHRVPQPQLFNHQEQENRVPQDQLCNHQDRESRAPKKYGKMCDFVRLIFLYVHREASILVGVTIPIDLSTWSFIPLPRFLKSRRAPPLLNPTLVLFPQQST